MQPKKLIAHRGNVTGPQPDRENRFDYLIEAIAAGYDVEVDVWKAGGSWFFGHNGPSYSVTLTQIQEIAPHAWFHIKNVAAGIAMGFHGFHSFTHDQEPYAYTSRGIKWSHRGEPNQLGIVCMPNLDTEQDLIRNCHGVCHDYLDRVIAIQNA